MTTGIPDRSNFFASLRTSLTRQQVAELYCFSGWTVRKCSWVDYEISCSWAELVIEAEEPILIHGSVADLLTHLEEILAPLRAAGVAFSGECYGPGDELVQEFRWQPE